MYIKKKYNYIIKEMALKVRIFIGSTSKVVELPYNINIDALCEEFEKLTMIYFVSDETANVWTRDQDKNIWYRVDVNINEGTISRTESLLKNLLQSEIHKAQHIKNATDELNKIEQTIKSLSI